MEEKNISKAEAKKIKAEKEKLKLETAKEIGLFDKIKEQGWKSLTSRESGKLGGKISAKIKCKNKEKK